MVKRILKWGAVVLGVLLGLFAWNGVNPSWKHPEMGLAPGAGEAAGEASDSQALREVRVLAFNLGKLGFHRSGLDFAEDFEVRARIQDVAAMIRETEADIVCLSEIVFEGGPSGVNQVTELAQASGLFHWSYADNYRFGFSFYGIRSGNAVLSRFPLRPLLVAELPGKAPFWNPTGRRRLLKCETSVAGEPLRIGSVRNDSVDLANNQAQCEAILLSIRSARVLLAGDFNAEPGDASMQLLKNSNQFSGAFEGQATFPSTGRRIDYVLAPRAWTLIEEKVLANEISDHAAVLARFQLP